MTELDYAVVADLEQPIELREEEFHLVSGGSSQIHVNNVRLLNNFHGNISNSFNIVPHFP